MTYARAERMLGSIKQNIAKSISLALQEWDQAVINVLSGYRRRELNCGYSPFQLFYENRPGMPRSEDVSLLPAPSGTNRIYENLARPAPGDYRLTRKPQEERTSDFSTPST